MKLTVVTRKCQAGPAFQEHAEKKLAKIDKLFAAAADETQAKITATAEHGQVVVEVTVAYRGLVLRAEQVGKQIADALDDCVDALIRQIRKNKTRVEKKLKAGKLAPLSENEAVVPEETDFALVRTKVVPLRPETPEEAILQMNLLAHQFYMFLNAENGAVNVVYRRKSGGYGLLEPEDGAVGT
jgi:putative sigma-54 modulation protein